MGRFMISFTSSVGCGRIPAMNNIALYEKRPSVLTIVTYDNKLIDTELWIIQAKEG